MLQNRDEDFAVARLSGHRIKHRNGVAGKIHEQLLTGRMRLAHGRRDPATPFAVEIAEPAIAIAVDLAAAILLPQQRQRHAAPAQLGMDTLQSGNGFECGGL